MNYVECLNRLASLGHEMRGVKFDLETTRRILETLGHPERRYPTAIVAGTNGKGSTAAILASILEQAGFTTGLYTSPHLIRTNERIRVNNREISDEDFAFCFTEVWLAAEALREQNVLSLHPSFFEILTATAFLHFARKPVDFAVLEVGMGGRLDSTNVTEPRVAIITNIDLDHQEFLGRTHAAIAAEKAGVIKPRRPVVSACEHAEAAKVIRQRASELNAPLIETPSFARLSNLRNIGGHYSFDLTLNGDHFEHLKTPLLGRFQSKNAVAAVTAAWRLRQEGFDFGRQAFARGLSRASWPGRLEVVCTRPLVVLDGAHNPAAAREIAAFANEEWANRTVRMVYASMRDKAIDEISEILFPIARELYLTETRQARAATPQEILAAARFQPPQVKLEADPARALGNAFRASRPEDVVLATGSLFLVGAIKEALEKGELVLAREGVHATAARSG